MARYYFHIGETDRGLDPVGVELPDLNDARIEAARMMGEMLKDRAGEFWSERSMKLIVTDESGLILFLLDLSAVEAPALSRQA